MMEYLFHYTKEKNIYSILHKETILFNNIYLTNDPYENKIFDMFDYKEISEHITDDNSYRYYFQHYTNMKNRIIKTISFCMGEYNNETINENNRPAYLYPRMWAQYGNNSKGVCFVFNKNMLINIIEKELSSDFYVFANPISYIDILNENHVNEIEKLIKNRNKIFKHPNQYKRKMLVRNIIDNIDKYFFIKDEDWEGEREFRILIINKSHNNDIKPKKIKIPMSEALHCVVLGENFTYRNEEEEQINFEKEIERIKLLCKNKKIGLSIIKRDIYRSKYILKKIL
jgi:hypothetical protein